MLDLSLDLSPVVTVSHGRTLCVVVSEIKTHAVVSEIKMRWQWDDPALIDTFDDLSFIIYPYYHTSDHDFKPLRYKH